MSASNDPVRVLVIDDEKGLRDMLSYTLRRLKFQAAVAEDGEKGVAAALAGDFEYLAKPYEMPALSAVIAAAAARKRGR